MTKLVKIFLESFIILIFLEYLLQNWALILILIAFAIMLKVTVFLDKKTVNKMYVLIAAVFVLSIIVFTEFYLGEINKYRMVRTVMMAIRYSATPIIIAMILYTLVRKAKWYVLAPTLIFAAFNIISIFTGIVFKISDTGELIRGPLGYLPYVAVGLYSFALIFVLFWQCNKQATEIIPIIFLAFALGTGLVFPFILGKDYSKIFCTTIAIALFVYYVFLILQLTKKDALTNLFNRQAYYPAIKGKRKDITAFVSIDMNGLKALNDNEGHLEGDKALKSLADCFSKAAKYHQYVYRMGGDEFVIICYKTSEEELQTLVTKIKKYVSETPYSCSIGYCYCADGSKTPREMVKESDKMMYKDKADFYKKNGKDRRIK